MDIKAMLEDALKELHKIGDRADVQDRCHQMRIPFGTIVKFDSPTWEVLFGSSGTGKTILFKARQEEAHCALTRPSVLPLYISGRNLRGAPGGQLSEPSKRAEAHFMTFLEQFAEELEAAAAKLRRRDRRAGVGGRRLRRQAQQVDELLNAIHRAVDQGRAVKLPGQTTHEEEQIVESSDRRRVFGGIRAWLGANFGFRIGGRAERSRSSDSVERGRRHRESRVEPDLREIRKRLVQLASTLGVDRFCVLLDEWSAIDSQVQPWFAEWLQHCFGSHKRIVFKIASNRTDTRLRDEGLRIGFRLGDDLDNAGALDHPQMSEADLAAFFELLLLKRLAVRRTDLADYFAGDTLGRPKPEFIDSMFADRHAFLTLVRGTEGNPRTFLRVFHKLVDRGLPAAGWTVSEVEELVGPPQRPTEMFKEELSETEITFQYHIRPVVVTTGSRYFLVRVEDRDVAREKLAEMLETELIYLDDSMVLPESLGDRFDGYWLSEEAWWSLGRSRLQMQGAEEGSLGPTEGWLHPKDPMIETPKDADPYVLDFSRYR